MSLLLPHQNPEAFQENVQRKLKRKDLRVLNPEVLLYIIVGSS
jgi:hypothetical protein